VNATDIALLEAPSIPRQVFCCFCGRASIIEMHHVVARYKAATR
jgi:hypothetical protein